MNVPIIGGLHQTGKGTVESSAVPVSISEHPLPLPLGEVAERSEDGEGKPGCKTLSVTYGDSSPKGRAKRGVPRYIERVDTKMERITPIRSIRCFTTTHSMTRGFSFTFFSAAGEPVSTVRSASDGAFRPSGRPYPAGCQPIPPPSGRSGRG